MTQDSEREWHRTQGESAIEAVARVVAIENGLAVLEPEPTGSCNGCMSAALCEAGNNKARRMLARRFTMPRADLAVGDRIVVGLPDASLLRGAIAAYGIPLAGMMGVMIAVNRLGGGEGRTIIGAIVGLVLGVAVARLYAARLAARGELSPQFIRRAYGPGPGEGCHSDLG